MAKYKYILTGGAGRSVTGSRIKFREVNCTQEKLKELYEMGISNIEREEIKVSKKKKTVSKPKTENEEVKKEQDNCCSEESSEEDCCEG